MPNQPVPVPPELVAQQSRAVADKSNSITNTELRQLATELQKPQITFDPSTVLKGQVTAINSAVTPPTVTVLISGDTSTPIVDVRYSSLYYPHVNDVVLLLKQGTDLMVLCTIAGAFPGMDTVYRYSIISYKTVTFDYTAHTNSYVVASLSIPDPGFSYRIRMYGSIIWDQGIDCWYDVALRLTDVNGVVINFGAGIQTAGFTAVAQNVYRQISGLTDVVSGAQVACFVLWRQTSINAGSGTTVQGSTGTPSLYNQFFAEVQPIPPVP